MSYNCDLGVLHIIWSQKYDFDVTVTQTVIWNMPYHDLDMGLNQNWALECVLKCDLEKCLRHNLCLMSLSLNGDLE